MQLLRFQIQAKGEFTGVKVRVIKKNYIPPFKLVNKKYYRILQRPFISQRRKIQYRFDLLRPEWE